jgi:hypothetical protein
MKNARPLEPLVVLLPSVLWRREGLDSVLSDLAKQSQLPECVHVFLDGWGSERPTIPHGLRVELHENESGQGAWARWHFIENLPPDQLVTTMDDDMAIEPSYIGYSSLSHRENGEAILSWGGHNEQYDRVWYNCSEMRVIPLVRPMAGITVFRARHLQGMTKMDGAEELIAKDSPEEALIAIWAWKHGRAIVRPMGAPGLSPLKTATDRRCNYYQHRTRWAHYFRRGEQLTGWPHGQKLAQTYGGA